MAGRIRPVPRDDGRSDVSGASSRTLASLMFSRSKLRTAQAKRLLADHKLKRLSEKQELQRAQKELELKQQLLGQMFELEEASLEKSVLAADRERGYCRGSRFRDVHVNPVTQDVCDARDHDRGITSLVQTIFYFWSFEIEECFLRTQKKSHV